MDFTALNLSLRGKRRFFFILLTIILVVLEELFERVFVECYCYENPSDERAEFACLLILPSIISFIIASAINKPFWKLSTGRLFKCRYIFRKSLWISLLAPLIWILIVFLDGDYLACLRAILNNYEKLKGNGTCSEVSTIDLSEIMFIQI